MSRQEINIGSWRIEKQAPRVASPKPNNPGYDKHKWGRNWFKITANRKSTAKMIWKVLKFRYDICPNQQLRINQPNSKWNMYKIESSD